MMRRPARETIPLVSVAPRLVEMVRMTRTKRYESSVSLYPCRSLADTLDAAEGQAQVRTASTSNNAYRPKKAQGRGSKCIDQTASDLSYVSVQAEVSADATRT